MFSTSDDTDNYGVMSPVNLDSIVGNGDTTGDLWNP